MKINKKEDKELQDKELENKRIVLITGCSSGIGYYMANQLTQRGYLVVATARNIKELEQVSASMKEALDVTDKSSIKKVVNKVMQEYGKIDLLINNAGYSIRGSLEEVPVNEMEKMFETNVFGIINMIQEVVPFMRKNNYGRVMNIGSISGRFSQIINGGYCASKFAVEALNSTLRMELKKFHIQSTVVEPGAMDTKFFQKLADKSEAYMNNIDSPYREFYQKDCEYRKKQNREDAEIAAKQICNILNKKRWKPAYRVAVPFSISFLLCLPQSYREFILQHI